MNFIKILNKIILEELSITYGGSPDEFFDPNWFSIEDPRVNLNRHQLNFSLKMVLEKYKRDYDVRVVKVKDGDKVIGFLLYSMTNKNKEEITDEGFPRHEFPIVLSTAIDPNYRGQGLLTKMLQKANIINEFLVHTSGVSPRKIWDRYNCKVVHDFGVEKGGVEYCKTNR